MIQFGRFVFLRILDMESVIKDVCEKWTQGMRKEGKQSNNIKNKRKIHRIIIEAEQM